MIKESVTKFMALAPLMLPRLIGNGRPDDTDINEDSAVLFFTLEEKLPVGLVMDMLEDDLEQVLLYHGTNKENPKQHHCCFFSNPGVGHDMYRFNVTSDNREMVDGITVTIYDSLDTMEGELENDLKAHEGRFDFIQAMTSIDLLELFCSWA